MERTVTLGTHGVGSRPFFHGRTAGEFVKVARRFEADIEVEVDGETERPGRRAYEGPVNAKSMTQVGTLCGTQPGAEFTLRADGPDAPEALEALSREIEWRLGG